MTKRALSLLLTLVMVLSLCVPAFAAEDGFVAEAPADVIEEAPAAPVEPEAPEAEEPAEEPVVDEPVAEEADAPEIAAIMEEEDLPYLVALGVVSKYNHYVLENTLETAETYKAKVDAGELYVAASYTKIDQEDSPAKAFLDAYDYAQKNLDGINGVVVDIDVTDASVEKAIADLEQYFSTDDGGDDLLISTLKNPTGLTADAMTEANLYAGLNVNKTYNAAAAQYSTYESLTVDKDTKFDTAKWTDAYKPEYLNALKTAQDAIKTFVKVGRDAEYKDFATARAAVLAAAELEKAATVPTAGDANALKAVIARADAVKDTYQAGIDNDVYAKPIATLFTPTTGMLAKAKALLSDTLGLNGLATNVKFEDVQKAIKDLNDALALRSNTFRVESYKMTAEGEFQIVVSIAKISGATDNDGYDYGYAIKLNDLWYNFTPPTSTSKEFDKDACIANIKSGTGRAWTDGGDKYPGRLVYTIYFGHIAKDTGVDGKPFELTDKPVVYFYVKNVKDTTGYVYGDSFSNQPLTIGKDTWFGPTIQDAWVSDYGDDDINTIKLNQLNAAQLGATDAIGDDIEVTVELNGDFYTYITTTLSGSQADFDLAVKNARGKNAMVSEGDWTHTATTVTTGTTADDTYVVAGTMTAAIDERVTVEGEPGVVTRTSLPFTVNPLSKWKAVKNINKILAAAKKLQQTDYNALNNFNEEDGCVNGRPDITSVQAAFQVITNDISKIESAINNSTLANTQYNRAAVMSDLIDLGTVYGYLAYKPVTVEQLNALLAECMPIEEDDYTYDSWGVFFDARYAASLVFNKNPLLQSDIDKAYADLLAAKNGLVEEGAVNKTALIAAIASAQALKAEDYTEQSWAANKDTIDAAVKAAQAVVDNPAATQAEVNTALNTLTAAVNQLVKVGGEEEGPHAPASGTGWDNYDGTWYFFKNGALVSNYWVGKIDGASKWDNNWYYVGADGKMATGMRYIDDLHGGFGWYYLQPTNKNGEIGKMLTGWQWVGGEYGTCYFSAKNGEAGKCTYSTLKGNWTGSGWEK